MALDYCRSGALPALAAVAAGAGTAVSREEVDEAHLRVARALLHGQGDWGLGHVPHLGGGAAGWGGHAAGNAAAASGGGKRSSSSAAAAHAPGASLSAHCGSSGAPLTLGGQSPALLLCATAGALLAWSLLAAATLGLWFGPEARGSLVSALAGGVALAGLVLFS